MTEAWLVIDLGNSGRNYVRSRLSKGKTFARNLLAKPELQSGQVFTVIPSSVDVSAARDFGGSILTEPPENQHRVVEDEAGRRSRLVLKPNMDAVLIRRIREHLRTGPGNLCVMEDALALPGDAWVRSSDTRYVSFDDELIHVLVSADETDEERITKTVRRARSWLFIAGMTSADSAHDFVDNRVLTNDRLRDLAEKTRAIVVDAYDGEGFVVWEASN